MTPEQTLDLALEALIHKANINKGKVWKHI
jgi:hypothetical protein